MTLNARLALIYWKEQLSFHKTCFCEDVSRTTEQRGSAYVCETNVQENSQELERNGAL